MLLYKYIILTTGDMSGNHLYGSDGVPTEFYKQFFILKTKIKLKKIILSI